MSVGNSHSSVASRENTVKCLAWIFLDSLRGLDDRGGDLLQQASLIKFLATDGQVNGSVSLDSIAGINIAPASDRGSDGLLSKAEKNNGRDRNLLDANHFECIENIWSRKKGGILIKGNKRFY
jgi:hypothetical protein